MGFISWTRRTYETVTLHDNLLGDAKDFLMENYRSKFSTPKAKRCRWNCRRQ